MMNLLTASRKLYLSDSTVSGFVVKKVFKLSLLEQLDGTGGMAIVVSRLGNWATPDPIQTARFPVLQVDCYADHTRTPQGEIDELDAADKAETLWDAVDKVTHAQRGVVWGGLNGLRIVSSQRWVEPDLHSKTNQRASIDKDLGDVVYLSSQYALEVG